ncbi:MAG: murein L,D-transpeptidase catalytic domain family protein [Lysobacteraceae bacterium]|nr:MAG: murein L,D-transpeptidase catalytic domain family protein [Xanthomonadaceae bacterium]
MRDLRLFLTLSATALLAGCAGPATKPELATTVRVAAPVPTGASIPEPAQVTHAASELDRLRRLAPELDPGVLALALEARSCAVRNGQADADARLAVIDYSLPSTRKRMWVFDVATDKLLFREHVAHGQGSGENVARRFSNVEGSYQTSLGLFRTAETYQGGNGYSLRMDGLDPGFNDAARQRAIVMHGAWYANPDLIRTQGRLGRSQGCPALREGIAKVVIDSLKQQQLLFAYADDAAFLQRGHSFACDGRNARQILASARDVPSGTGMMTAVAAP